MHLTIQNGRATVQAASKFTTGDELAKAIETAIKKHFPRSLVQVTVRKGLGGNAIYLVFAVAGSKDEVPNKIWNNDISLTKAFIDGVDAEGNLKERLEFDPAQGGSILAKSDDKMRAYSRIKVGLRKKKGTPEQILKHVDGYFAKLLKALKANADKIPDDHKSLLKSIKL